MPRDPRPTPRLLAALLPFALPFALAGCSGEPGKDGKKATGGTPAAVAGTTAPEPEAPKFEPGEKGYVAPRDGKQTPSLIQATKAGNLDAVKSMLDTGSDANAARDNGLTALHIAASENMLEIAKALLAKGADTSAKLEGGVTPLHMAATNPNGLEMVGLLLEHKAGVDAKDAVRSQTPLIAASALGHLEIVRLLLEKGASPAAVDKKGQTALIVASIGGHLEVVHLLLDKGAGVDAQNSDGATALHAAARFGHPEIAAALLARGAKVDIQDVQKLSPLHVAAGFGHREIADLLLANGANILLKAEAEATPAMLAEDPDLALYLSGLEKAAGGPGLDPARINKKPKAPGKQSKPPQR